MTFVAPLHNSVLTPASRRAVAVCRTKPKPPRQAPTMKKARRGATADEEENAVDVFGGAGMSQEDLLAAALGADTPPTEPNSSKKKKKTKKGVALAEDDPNAEVVSGGSDFAQEDSPVGNAAGETKSPSSMKTQKKKKNKKNIGDEEDNAVDVFGGANLTQEELLAQALGDPTDTAESTASPKKKSKKKKGKKGLDEDENNVVDVFGMNGKSQEELLAEALGEPLPESVTRGGSDKNTKDITPSKNLDTNISFSGTEATATGEDVDRREQIYGNIHETDDDDDDAAASDFSTFSPEDEEETTAEGSVVAERTNDTEEDDEFEPDPEVLDEFETAVDEFKQFTSVGRRERSKSKRSERGKADARLLDPKRSNFSTGGEKFTSVRLEDVSVVFRNSAILNGVTWGVRTGERVGLIGENGCGKTTQLRIIAGLIEPTSGEVVTSSSRTKASFLRQEFVDELDPRRTLREEFMAAFLEESKLIEEYKQCEIDIADAGEDLDALQNLLNRLEDLRGRCEAKDVWNLDARIDRVLPGLGFAEDDDEKLVASFSGGWKVRIGLGKVLLQDPDLLLLDEPSNHLDTESVEWLEKYLQTSKLPMVIVSHDREFLDRTCTKIVEIESGEAFEYPGNYSKYVELRKEQRKAWEAAYEKQQRFIKEQESYIKRNRKSAARAGQTKSRQKMLDRMVRTGQVVRRPPRRGKPLVFRFPPAPRSGRDCILIEELTHGYEGNALFKDSSIAVERGDRIALVGPNGCGKSTLLRLITGREKPQQGTVDCKELTNISLAYYEQNQADALDLDMTVLDTLRKAAPSDMRYEEIRALLGKFLFKGDDVEKQVRALSGGEKARLALAKIMMEPANVLILDEPGNHLSISAKEMLEEALQHFDGTLLLVSHDRYLISQVATQILAVEDKELVLYDGDYKSYMEKNQELKERLQARFIPGVVEIKNAPKIVIEQPAEIVDKKQKRKKTFGGSGIQSGRTKEMNAKRWSK